VTDDPGPAAGRVPNEPEAPGPVVDELAERRERRRETREVPSNLDTERALLSAAMWDPEAATIAASLDGDCWWSPAHLRIATAIGELERDGQAVDINTVVAQLKRAGALEMVGGMPGVQDLFREGGTGTSATTYARILRDDRDARATIAAAEAARDAAYDRNMGLARACLSSVLDEVPADDTVGDVADLAPGYLDLLLARESGDARGMPTGWFDLDEIIGGLHGGNLVVVGARTGTGKTATLAQLTLNLAKTGARALFVSLEMPWPELLDRWVGNLGWVDTRDLRRGHLGDNDWPRTTAALGDLAALGIRIAKPATVTVPQIRAEARQHGSDVILVDYLQLVRAVGRRNATRENDVGEISRTLKALALALDVPVVAAAQLNRGVEVRAVKRPELSDLRDSGQIEQDCDVAVMLYRPSGDDEEADPTHLELIVRKNRHGELGTAHMTFLGSTQHVVARAEPTGGRR
jgi:replicative DNA helicase